MLAIHQIHPYNPPQNGYTDGGPRHTCGVVRVSLGSVSCKWSSNSTKPALYGKHTSPL